MLPLTDLFTLFISGGPVGMITITLLFIGLPAGLRKSG